MRRVQNFSSSQKTRHVRYCKDHLVNVF